MRKLLLTICVIAATVAAHSSRASEVSLEQKLKIHKMAQNFYLKQAQSQLHQSQSLSALDNLSLQPNRCDPDDSRQGPSCVAELCKQTSCYGSSGKEIAEACRGSSGLCVETLCKQTSCYGSSGKEIAVACEGSDGACVVELCKQTSCYGSSGREIARSCSGQ